jgi:hypothetical protein
MSATQHVCDESHLTRVDEDDGTRYYECPWRGGDGHEMEGDLVIGDCAYCEGTGELDTNLWDWEHPA